MKKSVLLVFFCMLLCVTVSADYPRTLPANSAKCAAVMELTTGRLIGGKNAFDKASMASTTKIMTSILLIENADLTQEITCTKEMVTVEGSSMGLMEGDKVHYSDLLYGMLLASGNDAANTTAIAIAGSTDKFAEMMNQKAKEIGMIDTHFVTPSGLDNVEHYSTAYDMALLACYAMKNPVFAQAASSRSAKLNYGNPPYDRTLSNHNKLLSYYEGCIGVKTGFTKKSGRCLVSCARRDGKIVVCVTLNDPNDWTDHANLLDYGFSCIETKTMPGQSMQLPVLLSKQKAAVHSEDVTLSVFPEDTVETVTTYDTTLVAPIAAGETVEEVAYYISKKKIAASPLRVTGDVNVTTTNTNYWDWIVKLMIQ